MLTVDALLPRSGAHKQLWLLLFLTTCVPVSAEAEPSARRSLEDLVPDGYRMIAEARGDLQGDGLVDVVLVVQPRGKKAALDHPETCGRKLLLFLGRKSEGQLPSGTTRTSLTAKIISLLEGKFRMVAEYENAVLCGGQGGQFNEPLEGLKVSEGRLHIDYYGGGRSRWGIVQEFQFSGTRGPRLLLVAETRDFFDPVTDAGRIYEADYVSSQVRVSDRQSKKLLRTFRVLQATKVEALGCGMGQTCRLWRSAIPLVLARDDPIVRGKERWQGKADFSVEVRALATEALLFLRVVLTDDRPTGKERVFVFIKSESGQGVTRSQRFDGELVSKGQQELVYGLEIPLKDKHRVVPFLLVAEDHDPDGVTVMSTAGSPGEVYSRLLVTEHPRPCVPRFALPGNNGWDEIFQ